MIDECLAGKHVECVMKWTHPGWGERDLAVSYSPLGDSGESRTVVAVVRDVTNSKRLEELQMTSQHRIEMAERAGLPFGVWVWDFKTNRAQWSSEMFRQWGIDRGSFSGRPDVVMSRIHAEDRAAMDQVMRRALAGQTERYSVQFRICAARCFPVEMWSYPCTVARSFWAWWPHFSTFPAGSSGAMIRPIHMARGYPLCQTKALANGTVAHHRV